MDMFIWVIFCHNDIKKHEPKKFYKASVCKTIVGFSLSNYKRQTASSVVVLQHK